MDGTLAYDEAGASDNRLSLNPDQFEVTKDWEDGNTYNLALKVRQISPGEFEVIEATAAGEKPEEPGTEEQPQAQPNNEDIEQPGNYPNPAVSKMMKRGRDISMNGQT